MIAPTMTPEYMAENAIEHDLARLITFQPVHIGGVAVKNATDMTGNDIRYLVNTLKRTFTASYWNNLRTTKYNRPTSDTEYATKLPNTYEIYTKHRKQFLTYCVAIMQAFIQTPVQHTPHHKDDVQGVLKDMQKLYKIAAESIL